MEIYRAIYWWWCTVFALSPDKAIIADSNPELINMYRQVADNVEAVISYLKKYKNTKEDFYEVRSLDWFKLKKKKQQRERFI